MKLSGTVVSVIGAVVVLAGAFAIGLGIREIRSRRAETQSEPATEPDREQQVGNRPAPGAGGGQAFQDLSPEERAERREKRQKMIEQMASMSEEEKEKFKAQMSEKFGAMRRGDRRRTRDLSSGQRARRAAEWEKMREKWESMSEQEKEQFKARMRERTGSGQPGDGQIRRGPSSEEGARREEQSENVSEG